MEFYYESDSSSYSGKSEFDDEYYDLRPPDDSFSNSNKKIITIKAGQYSDPGDINSCVVYKIETQQQNQNKESVQSSSIVPETNFLQNKIGNLPKCTYATIVLKSSQSCNTTPHDLELKKRITTNQTTLDRKEKPISNQPIAKTNLDLINEHTLNSEVYVHSLKSSQSCNTTAHDLNRKRITINQMSLDGKEKPISNQAIAKTNPELIGEHTLTTENTNCCERLCSCLGQTLSTIFFPCF